MTSSIIVLHGLLDDMMLERGNDDDGTSTSTSTTETNNNSIRCGEYEDLLDELIFTTDDTKKVVLNRLEECTTDGFLEYLTTISTNETEEEDEEVRQAYQDLLNLIITVKSEVDDKKKKQAEAEAAQIKATAEAKLKAEAEETEQGNNKGKEKKPISATDLLKKANEIDQAVMVSEANDDELPDDFMRDAKLVRGLSGFNNRGQMRVGGGG